MPRVKPLSKEMIVAAQASTLSNLAASRYLHVSYKHYKRYTKMYTDSKTGKSLYEIHINWGGKGVPKFTKGNNSIQLKDILSGKVNASSWSSSKIKYKLIEEGYLLEECAVCKFKERRVLDYKIPLLMHFKDGNRHNYTTENIELLCYNDYFLQIGNIFNKKDIMQIEEQTPHHGTSETVEFEVDEYHLKRLKELGFGDDDDVNQYISRL